MRLALRGTPLRSLSRPSLLLAGILALVLGAAQAADLVIDARVGMSDGGTITVLDAAKVQHKVRLAGIDAEKARAFGERSKQNLSALVFGKDGRADCYKRDRYRRDVCRVDEWRRTTLNGPPRPPPSLLR